MDKIIITLIVVFNIFTIFMVYKLSKAREFTMRVAIPIISYAIIYIITSIIFSISNIGLDFSFNSYSRRMLTFTFVPINMIALVFPLVINYEKDEKDEKSKKNIKRILIIGLIIIVIEIAFMRNLKNGIIDLRKQTSELNKNVINTNEAINTMKTDKEIQNKYNTKSTNEIINTVKTDEEIQNKYNTKSTNVK